MTDEQVDPRPAELVRLDRRLAELELSAVRVAQERAGVLRGVNARLAELEQNVENLVAALRRLAVVDRLEGRVAELEKVSHRPVRNVPDADDLDRELAQISVRLDALEARRPPPVPVPPTPARMVLYRNMLGGVWPAIVTRVCDEAGTVVDLYAFNTEDRFPQPLHRVEHVAAEGAGVGWFWPPRV